MNVTEFATSAAAVIGLLTIIGGALVLIKGSYSKARIQALREDNEDLRNRVADGEQETIRLKAGVAELKIEVDRERSENQLLRQMVTQRANVDEVLDILNQHHDEAREQWAKANDLLAKLTAAIERLGPKQ
jgi:septal ring factor EnvC (AmiA/AmiB activator)